MWRSARAAVFQLMTGRPTIASLLTIAGPTVITLWTLLVGVLIWRNTFSEPRLKA